MLGQYLWYNKHITIAGKPIFWKAFARSGLTHVGHLCQNGKFLIWNQLKQKFGLSDTLQFKYIQLVNAIPLVWKEKIRNEHSFISINPYMHSQGILLCTRLVPLEGLNSKQIYDIVVRNANHIPTAQKTLQRKFQDLEPESWKKSIYCIEK